MEVIFLENFFANDCQDICFDPEKNLNLFSAASKKIIRFHYRLSGSFFTGSVIIVIKKSSNSFFIWNKDW